VKRPRNGAYTDIGTAMSGEFPCLWIRVEGSYNRLSPSQAKRIARLLLRQAEWMSEWQKAKKSS
jgi:hypothetical protein